MTKISQSVNSLLDHPARLTVPAGSENAKLYKVIRGIGAFANRAFFLEVRRVSFLVS